MATSNEKRRKNLLACLMSTVDAHEEDEKDIQRINVIIPDLFFPAKIMEDLRKHFHCECYIIMHQSRFADKRMSYSLMIEKPRNGLNIKG